jgi:hypothetical protein
MTLLFSAASARPVDSTRRFFIGGSDARIIMGTDEAALVRLWQEKRGETGPPDYSDNLLVQLGVATEPLKSALVRENDREAHQGRPELDSAPSAPLDGRYARWRRGR